MNATWDQSWGGWLGRAFVLGILAMLISMTLLPGMAQAALNVTYSADTSVSIPDNGIALTINSGSKADTVVVSGSTIAVTTTGILNDTFVIEAVNGNKLSNDGSLAECTKVDGVVTLTITSTGSTQTITVTPSTAICTSGGGGGGGGGGGVSVTSPACTITAPNGGTSLTGGASTTISWTTAGSGITDANLSYSVDSGVTWGLIVAGTLNDGSQAWTVPNTATTKGRVRVQCRDSGGAVLASDTSDNDFTISLDTGVPVTPAPTGAPAGVLTRTEANAQLPASFPVDTLIKLPDDGDPTTYTDTTVYYVGLDAKRHPFPGSQVYFSWYPDFSKVKAIDIGTIAKIPLGGPVLARPGMHWVKIQSDPKTYYVEPGGYTLRWIVDEATALTLGGSDWNKNIIDIEPTYFTKFAMGSSITNDSLKTSWPKGSLVKSASDATIWYSTGTARRKFASAAALTANNFQNKFVETNDAAGWKALPEGDAISGFEDGLFSLQHH